MGANLLILLGTIIVPLAVICFVSVVTFVNLYLNVRRRFPAKVNCWFCNHDTQVPYDQFNSFVCPACKQYNGFTSDGGYNREIPEQYQQRLNNYHYHHPSNVTDDDKWDSSTVRSLAGSGRLHTGNGLCFGCNRNQELKIHQLASFVPECEDNYEAEVEEYRRQLEQAYKLCGRCERVLKRTLNDVKRNVLGSKLAQIGSKSLNVLDMHIRSSTKQLAHQKRQRWAKICVWAISGLLLVKLHQHFSDTGLTFSDLMLLCPTSVTSAITMAFSYGVAMCELFTKQFDSLILEPAVQQTTECMESMGYEIFLQYVPQSVLQTSALYLDSISSRVPSDSSSAALLNVAIVALAALLLSLGSKRTIIKQVLIVMFCAADWAVKYAAVKDASIIALVFTTGALTLSLSCIGQRVIRSDVPSSNLNSSFHKIYSQQCKESDYSDAETSNVGDQPSFTNTVQRSFGSNSPPSLHRTITGDMSGKSLDTTKSGSPSGFSLSVTNPFLAADGSPPSLRSGNKISGSMFNVAGMGTTDKESVFSGNSITPDAAAHSLLKTPSFSVDNFQAVPHGLTYRRNVRLSGPGSIASAATNHCNSSQFRYSMSTINQEPMDRPYRVEEDQLIEDDIDRLSISGHMSLNASTGLGSRMSLTGGATNPFAKKTLHEPDYDEQSVARSDHRARVFRAPEPFKAYAKDTLWSAGGGGFGGQLTHMSRTSSQSSGFESQAGTTRRNTPTEVDNGSTLDMPSNRGSHHIASQFRSEQPSPVPSSASIFEWKKLNGTSFGSSSQQQRSLFSEQNLFNTALQPGEGATAAFTTERSAGLFFPKLARTSTVSNGSIASGATITPHNFRHIFPPQQSQTPSYHHQYSHNAAGAPFGTTTASFVSKASLPPSCSTASLASAGRFTSNKSTVNGRASLLNVNKLTNELCNGTLPTA
uniref:Ima1 N-terminal domain-containing protein n=1 Tax=Anopheles epiroticus TaxID=199890 RepID=A0A182PRJ1_9DIPT